MFYLWEIGRFNLIQNHIIKDLVDYVLGVEVGMDINARKNRNGKALESLVKSYLLKVGLIENKTYFKQMPISQFEKKFSFDLSGLSDNGKIEKVFDFVFVGALGTVFICECNFYGRSLSKLNETARSYKTLALE